MLIGQGLAEETLEEYKGNRVRRTVSRREVSLGSRYSLISEVRNRGGSQISRILYKLMVELGQIVKEIIIKTLNNFLNFKFIIVLI